MRVEGERAAQEVGAAGYVAAGEVDGASVIEQARVGRAQLQRSIDGDACLDGPVSAALYAVHPAERAGYLAALDAIRTMTARVQAPWWVSGLGFRVADRALADEPCPPRTDLLLLSTVDEQVLFDARAVRGFRIGRGMAEVVDVLLHSSRPDVALERLYRCPNVPGDPARTAGEVCAELARRGVSLPWAPAPARAA